MPGKPRPAETEACLGQVTRGYQGGRPDAGLAPPEELQGAANEKNPSSPHYLRRFRNVYDSSAHLGRSTHDVPAGGSK